MVEFSCKKLAIKMELEDTDNMKLWDEGILQLHEEYQSFLQLKAFDLENDAIFFNFKNRTRLVNSTPK